MQHWALAESLLELRKRLPGEGHLLFVTSHSMAPWSVPRELPKPDSDGTRARFDRARERLATPSSAYERAWAALSARSGLPYPSSALFAKELWTGSLSLTLCEKEEPVAKEIAGWLALPELQDGVRRRELHRGDWRERFKKGFAMVDGASALFIEMDPMRFESHAPPEGRDDRAALFPEDLPIVVAAAATVAVPTVVLISSFSANNNNPHSVVEPAITQALSQGGFTLAGRIEANGHMLSLVYSRALQLWDVAQPFGARFVDWFSKI